MKMEVILEKIKKLEWSLAYHKKIFEETEEELSHWKKIMEEEE